MPPSVIANQCAHWCGNPFSIPPGAYFLCGQKVGKEPPKGERVRMGLLHFAAVTAVSISAPPFFLSKPNPLRWASVWQFSLETPH